VTTELAPSDLYRRCDPAAIPFDSTAAYAGALEIPGQARAIDAARFALAMRRDGYNLFAIGPKGVGKETIVRELLEREARTQPTPADWCYVFDFADGRHPRALRLPAGDAGRLRADMARAIGELTTAMVAAFDGDEYRSRKHALIREAKQREGAALEALQERARARRVGVVRTDSGIVVAAVKEGQVIEPDEFERLPADEQATLRAALEEVGNELSAMFTQAHEWAHAHAAAQLALEREIAEGVTRGVFDGVAAGYLDQPDVLTYLADVARDVVEQAARFTAKPDDGVPEVLRQALHQHDDGRERLRRYEVNPLVDHKDDHGAPVVSEENPTYANLLGRVEHVAELGALVTNFTLIRAGALHRANGGYLLIDALKLLQQPFAWEALKRALRTRELRIEGLGQALGMVPTVSLEPAPIPLDVKVVLFGDRNVYYLLAAVDPEFDDLFKVMADFESAMPRGPSADAAYATLVAGLAHEAGLRPFDRGAVARVIEHAARLASDAHRLSIHLRSIADLLCEADACAGVAGRAIATAPDVEAALAGQERRAGRMRERMLEEVTRGTVLIATSGVAVGQLNGLSVIDAGGHAFGFPTRISARARVGGGDVVDIEREVALGGPLHSKGVLILAGLLGARYAPHMPLALSASIVFEQSYGAVEGDSASLAELCVLLSAIGEVPVRQGLALTGSINQHGEVQAIGGVNEKIEGFFDVCAARGLTGDQGVIIPRANVPHLMLRADVVAAVAAGRFHIHAVADVDEALALLTDRAAGAREASGHFARGSVNAQIEARLAAFADDARRFSRDRGERPHRVSSMPN